MVQRYVDDAVIVFVQILQQRTIHHELSDDVHWLIFSTYAHQLHQLPMPQLVHNLRLVKKCFDRHRLRLQCFDGNVHHPTPFTCKLHPRNAWHSLNKKSRLLSHCQQPHSCAWHQLSVLSLQTGSGHKKSFSTVLFIHTSDYLRYLRTKQTVIHLPTPLKMSPHQLVKCKTFSSDWRFAEFFQALEALKRTSCELSSVALKKTGCDVWQLECQASNVTASVQSDHLLH